MRCHTADWRPAPEVQKIWVLSVWIQVVPKGHFKEYGMLSEKDAPEFWAEELRGYVQ